MITIYLTRHGETVFNVKEYIQGQSDAPLTENGIQGAVNLGEKMAHINFDLAISSDLRRAIRTKDFILQANKNHTPHQLMNPEFGELDFGEEEGDDGSTYWKDKGVLLGKDFDAIGKEDIFEKFDHVYHEIDNPTAERGEAFKNRILKAMEDTVALAQENDYKDILVVSHGLVVMGAIQLFDSAENASGYIHNASVTKITYKDGQFKVEYFGRRDDI